MDFTSLIEWFTSQARKLPWRENRTGWSVLVSEIMLQQTQAATVIPYYKRWMDRFPTPEALAQADEEEVLKMWEGLGYYRRARALQSAAIALSTLESLPTAQEDWIRLPGIGPYTSAAVAAFAYQQRTAPVDGNVMRVMTRLFNIELDIAKASTSKILRELLLEKLPQKQAHVVAEGLIELGATLCKPQPQCDKCPLKEACLARQAGKERLLPIKSKGASTQILYRNVAVIQSAEGCWLVAKKLSPGIFQGLWLFPYLEKDDPHVEDADLLLENFQAELGLKLHTPFLLKTRKHNFTRYRAHLTPVAMQTLKEKKLKPTEMWHYEWVDSKELLSLTFCSGYREIRQEISLTQALDHEPS